MNKKRILIIICVVLVLVLVGSGVYVWKSKNVSQDASPGVASVLTPTPEELLTWEDPAGFSFQYPKGIDINKHDEDQDNYAHVELTNKEHPGSIILWAKDLPIGVTDIASWVKKDKTFVSANIMDTTLGSQPGKKILVASPSGKLIVGTVYDELLWYVETMPEDAMYWNSVHDTILNSYAFVSFDKPAGSQPAGGDQAGGGDEGGQGEVDEEEVIE